MSTPHGPALAAMELGSIARGLVVVDRLVKRARVAVSAAEPITPGKFVIVFSGAEAEVEEALSAAREEAADERLDDLLLPHVHGQLLAGLAGSVLPPIVNAVGILELATVCATLHGADVALKAAAVELVVVDLARGIGGKGYFVVTGTQDMVEAALEAADAAVPSRMRVGREIIPRPHPELDPVLGRLAERRTLLSRRAP